MTESHLVQDERLGEISNWENVKEVVERVKSDQERCENKNRILEIACSLKGHR